MRCAILTDIHANREAFEAVLADVEGRGIDRFVFLGDLVGYGPDPDWVLDRVETMVAKGALAVRGNHDRTAPALHISPAARRVIDWTVNRLTARQKLFLDDLPLLLREEGLLFAHASAHAPQDWPYITDTDAAAQCLNDSDAAVTFVGHAHIPALYSQTTQGQMMRHSIDMDTETSLDLALRWLVVTGPVSQPRDGSKGAQYCIFDTASASLRFARVPYDSEATLARAKQVGLPNLAPLEFGAR